MKKVLFNRQSPCIQPLRRQIEAMNHQSLVLWALDCAPRFLPLFEAARPGDLRPRELLPIADAWARGDVKMPLAKAAIHAAHNAATDAQATPAAQAAARAIGHAAATIHVETHALGLVFYGLTALIRAQEGRPEETVAAEGCAWFLERLIYWQAQEPRTMRPWAGFLAREGVPNKERLLRERAEGRG